MRFPGAMLIGMLLILSSGPAQALEDIPRAYRDAAAEIPVSPTVFYALALLESGQSERTPGYRPWPWTLTVNGKPHFFDSRAMAEAFLRQAIAAAPEQLGIGLYQIEHRFHAHRFDGLEQMLDPWHNVRVAADIFREALAREGGNVWQAVGRFHSGTPRFALAYQRRFGMKLLQLIGEAS